MSSEKKQLELLLEIVDEYAKHKPHCKAEWTSAKGSCDCGLEEMVQEFKRERAKTLGAKVDPSRTF